MGQWEESTCLPDGSIGKEFTCNAGDTGDVGSIPGSGRSPGGGDGNPLQYSCLQISMDREAWWATVQRVTESWIQLSDVAHTHANRGDVGSIPGLGRFHMLQSK